MQTYSSEVQNQIAASIELLQSLLGSSLLGVYLYGSAVVGGLQKYSDLDLFVVTNRKTTKQEKTELISRLLTVSGIYMKGSRPPIELTLVEKNAINPWRYPPHFDFQYGEWLRESFENGVVDPWKTHEMPDLAILVTQVLLKSTTLWGAKPQELLDEVPPQDFFKAMLDDVERLSDELESDTRNVLLTLARMWSALETHSIRSKPAAADWAILHLEEQFRPVLHRAKSICIGDENEYWEDVKRDIRPCAEFMVHKIIEQASIIDTRRRVTIEEQV